LQQILPYQPADAAQVTAVWHRAGLDEYDYLPEFQALTATAALRVFESVIVPDATVWVGWQQDPPGRRVAGFIALRGSYVDRLYVDPDLQRQGWGSRLLDFAKGQQPQGLELHTHQQNRRARAFYESSGFHAVRYGISPAPENVPDVEYHWRPDDL